MSAELQEHQFQAETTQLLDIVINSLYTSKDIFLRELISNSSDALDKLRFESLLNPELLGSNTALEIRLETDSSARTLKISDTGIGMSPDEVVKNIGTIARSGTRELREQIAKGVSKDALSQFIGQFGVGFYSAFMVADRITLVTRRAGETAATKWESTGNGYYTISEAERADRGTSITLHLKPIDPETGIEDFTDRWVISRIVRKYSDFISYPIIFAGPDAARVNSNSLTGAEPDTTEVDTILNSMKPIWIRPESDVTDQEYLELYRHISHDWGEPWKTIRLKAEGRIEYQALIYIPSKAPQDLYYHAADFGLRLYANKVMIMEHCPDLLPKYLRFLKGIVDSADLPLNISRQMLQQDRHITQIKKWLIKKVLSTLQEIYDKQPDKYLEFWKEFGRAFKEGVSSDYENKDKIVALLLFESSASPNKLTTLGSYIERMKEGQTEIFYFTGESRRIVENSPHIEAFREKGYEILYLVDPVDELLVQTLTEYNGKKLKSVGKGKVKIEETDDASIKEQETESTTLLDQIQKSLDTYVKRVRLTNRLTTSPACLVVEEHEYSPNLERLLQRGTPAGDKPRRILELNPNHRVFKNLKDRFAKDSADLAIGEYAEVLLGCALLAEGSELHDSVRFNDLVVKLMT